MPLEKGTFGTTETRMAGNLRRPKKIFFSYFFSARPPFPAPPRRRCQAKRSLARAAVWRNHLAENPPQNEGEAGACFDPSHSAPPGLTVPGTAEAGQERLAEYKHGRVLEAASRGAPFAASSSSTSCLQRKRSVFRAGRPALPPSSFCKDAPWASHSRGPPPLGGLQPGSFLLRPPWSEAKGHLLSTSRERLSLSCHPRQPGSAHASCRVKKRKWQKTHTPPKNPDCSHPLSSNTAFLGLPGHLWRGPAIGRLGCTFMGTRNLLEWLAS